MPILPVKRITVVVFAHNNETTIERCLRAIEMQSCRDVVEIFVHDDSSTDATAHLAKEFFRESLIDGHVFSSDENRYQHGIGFFLEVLLSLRTEYVALCDADDFWLSTDKLKVQMAALDEDPSLALVHHQYFPTLEPSGSALLALPRDAFRETVSGTELLNGNFIGACTAFFRTAHLHSVENWDGFDNLTVPDYPIWCALAIGRKIGFVEGVDAVYSIRESSMSESLRLQGLYEASERTRLWATARFIVGPPPPPLSPSIGARLMKSLLLAWNPRVSTIWTLQGWLGKVRGNSFPLNGN